MYRLIGNFTFFYKYFYKIFVDLGHLGFGVRGRCPKPVLIHGSVMFTWILI